MKAAEAAQGEAEATWQEALSSMPNLTSEETPPGGEDDFVVLETVGTPRDFAAEGFEPRDHVELGRMLGAIDIERGAKVSGSRFYFLTGVGAQLELALVNLAMEQAREAGQQQRQIFGRFALDRNGYLDRDEMAAAARQRPRRARQRLSLERTSSGYCGARRLARSSPSSARSISVDSSNSARSACFSGFSSPPPRFCLLYTSPSPRDQRGSRMPSSA